MNVLFQKAWSPYVVGAGIGVLSWFAFATANHPLGITTPFEHSAALVMEAVDPTITTRHAYFLDPDHSPIIGWEWMLVLGVFVGSGLSAYLSGDRAREVVPNLWKWRFGQSIPTRIFGAFVGGACMMFGARLAKGCTSGHGISGTLQLAVSSWFFVIVIFMVSVLTAFLIFGKRGRDHV
ncbi:MAG: YeeE/YedE family protein [Nitrospira sp.]|nr:YeeE/YedE family protein [Nitrospira sp.]